MSEWVVPSKVPKVNTPIRPRSVGHDETPSVITDHKFAPMGEWYTRCKRCRLAEAAHAQSEIQYYGDDE